MSEEDKKKPGQMSIRQGHIWLVDENGEEDEISLWSIIQDMKKTIKATKRNSFYVKVVRECISQLDSSGLRGIPIVMDKLGDVACIKKISGFTMGGKDNTKVDHRSNVCSSQNNNFLESKFGIQVGKPSNNKKKEEKNLGLCTELLAMQYYKKWHKFLGMIKQFGSQKSKKSDSPNKLYSENHEKIFKK